VTVPKLSHDELVARLRAHTHQPIPDVVRAQHLAAIDAAATWADAHQPTPSATGTHGWRRPVTVLVTAATFASASGVAVASQDAQPGQRLYGVKILSERLTGALVDDLVARRRVEELARLISQESDEATIQQAVARATDAVAGLPADHPLHGELAVLLALLQPPPAPSTGDGDPAGDGAPVIPHDEAEPRAERRADDDTDTGSTTATEDDDDTDDDDTDDTDDRPVEQAPVVTEPDDDDTDDDDTDDEPDSVTGPAEVDEAHEPEDDDPTDADAAQPDDDDTIDGDVEPAVAGD
jgi:hypothetical protein